MTTDQANRSLKPATVSSVVLTIASGRPLARVDECSCDTESCIRLPGFHDIKMPTFIRICRSHDSRCIGGVLLANLHLSKVGAEEGGAYSSINPISESVDCNSLYARNA